MKSQRPILFIYCICRSIINHIAFPHIYFLPIYNFRGWLLLYPHSNEISNPKQVIIQIFWFGVASLNVLSTLQDLILWFDDEHSISDNARFLNFEQFTLFTVENPLTLNFNNNWCSLIFSSYTQFWTQKKNCRRHENRENCARILCRERRAQYWRQVQNVLLKYVES